MDTEMQQDEDNHKSGSTSCNATPQNLQRTPRECGSGRREMKTHSQEVKRRIHYTPQNSPDKYHKTPQSSGSFRKDVKSQLESNKRKGQPSHNESLEKIPKTWPSGKFVNTLIAQWSKQMGIQTPLSQTAGPQESPIAEEMRRVYATEERKIQLLQKKLQAAEETISSLSASRETELRAKEELLRQLNTDWESITKYYYEISESLKGFQQHKDNLSALYNNISVKQQLMVKKLQQELSNMRLKDEEQRNIVATAESKIVNQEKRIRQMMIVETELKKQLEDIKSTVASEKNRLNNIQAEERLELIKKQEKLTSVTEELQLQIKRITEEKQNLTNLLEQKDKETAKLEEEIFTCNNKIEGLLCQNAELGANYEKSVEREGELSKQLESKVQEVDRLRENLDTRQEIESSLAKDLDMIETKYRTIQNDFMNVESKLKEMQTRNVDLERSVQDMKNNNENSVVQLNKRIRVLEKEKETLLSEKRAKIQELENSRKSLQEKYELEVSALKKDCDIKLSEMKNTIAMQNSDLIKLNETLNKMNEENQNRRVKHNSTKGSQGNLKEGAEPIIESNLTEVSKAYETRSQPKVSQIRERREQSEDEKRIRTPKSASKDKEEMSNQEEQDVYNFDTTKINNELPTILSPLRQEKKMRFVLYSPTKVSDYTENYSSLNRNKEVTKLIIGSQEKQDRKKEDSNDTPQKKKIFKTRGTGLRQYGTPRKMFKK